jgi:hypothetical protein
MAEKGKPQRPLSAAGKDPQFALEHVPVLSCPSGKGIPVTPMGFETSPAFVPKLAEPFAKLLPLLIHFGFPFDFFRRALLNQRRVSGFYSALSS